MKFTGQPPHNKIDVTIAYREFTDADLTDIFVKAITMLVQAVGAARVKDTSADTEAKRWAKEFLVGYGLLAIGEARSILLLFSDRLNIHARIHLRSLYEYELKIKLLLEDDEKVLKFRDAFAYEMRDFAAKLGKTPSEIDAEIERVLGIDDASRVTGTKERDALGGNVKEQMKGELQPEVRYLGTFAWASQVSHGSVLALHELAKATDGKTNDLLFYASSDAKGNALLYYAVGHPRVRRTPGTRIWNRHSSGHRTHRTRSTSQRKAENRDARAGSGRPQDARREAEMQERKLSIGAWRMHGLARKRRFPVEWLAARASPECRPIVNDDVRRR